MPGRWRVVARISGFRLWQAEVVLAPGERRTIDVGPLDPGVTIAGTVVDAAGAPVGGATVSLLDGTWNSLGSATKDDGAFTPLSAPPGPVVVEVVAEGYVITRTRIDASFGMPPVRLRLFRGGCAEVRVRRANGDPVTATPVVATRPDASMVAAASPSGPFVPASFGEHLVTDEQGVVRIHAAPGTYHVRIGSVAEVEVRIEDERTSVWTVTAR
jgi:hypothetical protein